MNPLQKLKQFFINLISSKLNKTTSLNKVSLKPQTTTLPKPQTTTLPKPQTTTPKSVTELPTSVITVESSEIPYLEPGIVIDCCVHMRMEDFQKELDSYGPSIREKLQNSPIYVLDTIKKEYQHKKCPKNYDEMMRSSSLHPNKYTGEPRNFNRTLGAWFDSLGVKIYFVEAEKSSQVRKSAKKCLTELKKFGLHKPDHMYLGFARITKSTVMTLDCKMIRSAKKGKVKIIDFREFLDKVMYPKPSPMTKLEEDRQDYNKKHAKTIELYGRLETQ